MEATVNPAAEILNSYRGLILEIVASATSKQTPAQDVLLTSYRHELRLSIDDLAADLAVARAVFRIELEAERLRTNPSLRQMRLQAAAQLRAKNPRVFEVAQ